MDGALCQSSFHSDLYQMKRAASLRCCGSRSSGGGARCNSDSGGSYRLNVPTMKRRGGPNAYRDEIRVHRKHGRGAREGGLSNEVYDREPVPNLPKVPGVRSVARLRTELTSLDIGGQPKRVGRGEGAYPPARRRSRSPWRM